MSAKLIVYSQFPRNTIAHCFYGPSHGCAKQLRKGSGKLFTRINEAATKLAHSSCMGTVVLAPVKPLKSYTVRHENELTVAKAMLRCMIIVLLFGLGACESNTGLCGCQGKVTVSDSFPHVGGDTSISCTIPRQCLNTSNTKHICFIHHFFSRQKAGLQARVIPQKRLLHQGHGRVQLSVQNVAFSDTGSYSCHFSDTPLNCHGNCVVDKTLVGKLDIECGGIVTPEKSVYSYGANVTFKCNIDTRCLSDQFNVQDLYFSHNDIPLPQAPTRVTAINSTHYVLTNITFQDKGYYVCLLNTSSADRKREYVVGHQILDIDYGPTSPTDHRCISYNFHSLNCTFIYPLVHSMRRRQKFTATYNLIQSRTHGEGTLRCTVHYGNPKTYTVIDCSLNMVVAEQPYVIFFNSSHADLGSKITRYEIVAKSSIVKLNAVKKLKITHITSSSIMLSWLPPDGENFKDVVATKLLTLHYNVTWWSEWGTFNSQVTTNSALGEILYNITSLVPHTSYTISVKIKPQKSDYWSAPATVEGRTLSEVPAVSPLVPPGGFTFLHCDGCNMMRLYWQDIPPWLRNGKIECYEVLVEGGNPVCVEPNEYHFDINLHAVSGQTVQLSVRNTVGLSSNSTIFDIRERTDDSSTPKFNVGVERLSSQELLVLWNLPENILETFLYFCKIDDKDRVCASPLYFIANPPDTLNSTIDVKARYGYSTNSVKVGFGYAATTVDRGRHYSGITWHCVLSGPIVPKAPTAKSSENELINGMPKVTITWSPVGCDGSSERVESYIVNVCEIDNCQGTKYNFSVPATGTAITTPLLGQLYPRTVYDVYVTAVTRYKDGEAPTDFQRHRFKTKSVDLLVLVNDDDPGTANISFTSMAYLNDTFVTAILKHKKLLGQVLRPKHGNSVIFFKVKCDSGKKVNMVFRLFTRTPGGGKRQLSDDFSVEMCRGKPLSTVLLITIVFSCVVIGGLVVALCIWLVRGVQKEKRVMKKAAITIPGGKNCYVEGLKARDEDEDYQDGEEGREEEEDEEGANSATPLVSSAHHVDNCSHLMASEPRSGLHDVNAPNIACPLILGSTDSGCCDVAMSRDTGHPEVSDGSTSHVNDARPAVVQDKNGYVPHSSINEQTGELLEQKVNLLECVEKKDSGNSGPFSYKPVMVIGMPDKKTVPDEGYSKYGQQDASQNVSLV